MSANTQARRAAAAHLLFNVFGVVWILCCFFPFVRLVCRIVGMDPNAEMQEPAQLTFALATFHTLFNVTNTLILIWFIPQIEKIVCKLIKPKKSEEEEEDFFFRIWKAWIPWKNRYPSQGKRAGSVRMRR